MHIKNLKITNRLGTNGFNLPMNNSLPLKVSPILTLQIYHINQKDKGVTFHTSIPSHFTKLSLPTHQLVNHPTLVLEQAKPHNSNSKLQITQCNNIQSIQLPPFEYVNTPQILYHQTPITITNKRLVPKFLQFYPIQKSFSHCITSAHMRLTHLS